MRVSEKCVKLLYDLWDGKIAKEEFDSELKKMQEAQLYFSFARKENAKNG